MNAPYRIDDTITFDGEEMTVVTFRHPRGGRQILTARTASGELTTVVVDLARDGELVVPLVAIDVARAVALDVLNDRRQRRAVPCEVNILAAAVVSLTGGATPCAG
jgi:hypothetical protein